MNIWELKGWRWGEHSGSVKLFCCWSLPYTLRRSGLPYTAPRCSYFDTAATRCRALPLPHGCGERSPSLPARWHGWVSHGATSGAARSCGPPGPLGAEGAPTSPCGCRGKRPGGSKRARIILKKRRKSRHGKPPRGRFCFSPLAINSCNLQSLA